VEFVLSPVVPLPRHSTAREKLDRFGNVLDRLHAESFVTQREFISQVLANSAQDPDAARFSQTLQSGRDIDSVVVNLLPSTITSPRFTPMRNSILRSGGRVAFSTLSPLWISTVQFTVSTTLANSARTLSQQS
jgi:hypothetical protein